MASPVTIANLALSHLGRAGTITSIDPSDGSQSANVMAQFYPLALNNLLNEANWSFAVQTVSLATVDNPNSLWAYAFEQPSDCVTPIALYEYDAQGDVYGSPGLNAVYYPQGYTNGLIALTTQQDFSVEGNVIFTNQPTPILKYVSNNIDASQFPPAFQTALSYLLASLAAGSLLKADTGAAASKALFGAYDVWRGKAETNDTQNRHSHLKYVPSGISARASLPRR